jgi:hypothetical protein
VTGTVIKAIVITLVVVVVLALAAVLGLLDWLIDDESERNDLGGMPAAELVLR